MPLIRSPTVKPPSVEARTAISLVVPATPLPPLPLPSSAEIRPLTKVPCPTSPSRPRRRTASKTRTTWPGIRMADVDAGVDDGDRAPRPAAGGRQRRGGADLVVRPGEGGCSACGGRGTSNASGGSRAGCDRARHRSRAGRRASAAPPRPQRAGGGREGVDGRRIAGPGAEIAQGRPAGAGTVGVGAGADEDARSGGGRRGEAAAVPAGAPRRTLAPGSRERQREHAGRTPARRPIEAPRRRGLAIQDRLWSRSNRGAGQPAPPRRENILRTLPAQRPMVGAPRGPASLRGQCCRSSTSARST